MTLIAWTAAYAVFVIVVILAVLLTLCLASLMTTGRTRLIIQLVLALVGLVIAAIMY